MITKVHVPNNVDLRLTVGDLVVDNNCFLRQQFWDSFPTIAKDIDKVGTAHDTTDELRWSLCSDAQPKIRDFY